MADDDLTYYEHKLYSKLEDNIEAAIIRWNVTKGITVGEFLAYCHRDTFQNLKDFVELTDEELVNKEYHDYPSDYALACIAQGFLKKSTFTWDYVCRFVNQLEKIWKYDDLFDWNEDKGILTINTGGWSGNEDIVDALDITLLYMCKLNIRDSCNNIYDLNRVSWREGGPKGVTGNGVYNCKFMLDNKPFEYITEHNSLSLAMEELEVKVFNAIWDEKHWSYNPTEEVLEPETEGK